MCGAILPSLLVCYIYTQSEISLLHLYTCAYATDDARPVGEDGSCLVLFIGSACVVRGCVFFKLRDHCLIASGGRHRSIAASSWTGEDHHMLRDPSLGNK